MNTAITKSSPKPTAARVADLRATAARTREYHRLIIGDPSFVVARADEIDEIAARLEAGEPEADLVKEAEAKRAREDIADAVERITEALVDLRLASDRLGA